MQNPFLTQNLKYGDSSSLVYQLQDTLHMLEEQYIVVQEEFVEEIFGPSTEENVANFQRWNDLQVSGIVDDRTAELIWSQFEQLELLQNIGRIVDQDGNEILDPLIIEVYWEDGFLLKRTTTIGDGVLAIIFSQSQFDNYHLQHQPVRLKVLSIEREEIEIIGDNQFLLADQAEIKLNLQIPSNVEEPEVEAPSLLIKGQVEDLLQRGLKNAIVRLNKIGELSIVLEAQPSDRTGQFEFVLEGYHFDLAMDCADFYFIVIYQDQEVANTQTSEPAILWNIGKDQEESIVIPCNVAGMVIDELVPKEKAIRFSEHGNKTINEIKKDNDSQNFWKELQNEASDTVKKQIIEAVGEDVDEEVIAAIQSVDFGKCAGIALPINDYLNSQLKKGKVKQSQYDVVQKKLEDSNLPEKMDHYLPEDKPLHSLPLFSQAIEEGQVHRLASVVSLGDVKCQQILQKGLYLNDNNFQVLDALQADGTLSEKETTDLKDVAELNTLFDGDLKLITPIKTQELPVLNRKLNDLKDLVPLRANNWTSLLEEQDIIPPDGMEREVYAQVIEKRIEKAFPSAVFLDRYENTTMENLDADFDGLKTVLASNPDLFVHGQLGAVDTSDMDEVEVETLKENFTAVKKRLNRYHGLGIDRPNFSEGELEENLRGIHEKVELVESFYNNNAQLDLLYLDLGPEADFEDQGIDFTGIQDSERILVLRNVKTDQRLYHLSDDITFAQNLKEAGYFTVAQINSVSLTTFAYDLGLPTDVVSYVYDKADQKVALSNELMAKFLEKRNGNAFAIGGQFDWVRNASSPIPNNKIVSFENEVLRKYDGYEDFFGSLDYCNCGHCNSIFSPAAYFVDLLAWLEKMVLNDTFRGDKETFREDKENHRLNLKNRRPDLWYLDLSCKNTKELIPSLDIINEVLENGIYFHQNENWNQVFENRLGGLNLWQKLEDEGRDAVVAEAYKGMYNYDQSEFYSINAPFLLPLEELKVFLKHFPITLEQIAKTYKTGDQEIQTKARLGISERAYYSLIKGIREVNDDLGNTITLCDYSNIDSLSSLQKLLDIKIVDSDGNYDPINVKHLIRSLGVSRTEFTQLIDTVFINQKDINELVVKAEKANKDEDLQNTIESLYIKDAIQDPQGNSAIPALGRIHRFIRLWLILPWTIGELDYVLYNLHIVEGDGGNQREISASKLNNLASLASLYNRFDIAIDELCLLFTVMGNNDPLYPNGISGRLLDSRFNKPPFTDQNPYPKNELFVHPTLNDIAEEFKTPEELPRLLAGLGITDGVFYQLIESKALKPILEPANQPPYTSANPPGFALNLSNISLLYRHSKLASVLYLSIPDLFRLISLSTVAKPYIDNGAWQDLQLMLAYFDWWRTTNYSLDDLEFVRGEGTMDPKPLVFAQELLNNIDDNQSLIFKDTLFGFLDGVTEEQSKEIIKLNISDPTPDPNADPIKLANLKTYRVKGDATLTSLDALVKYKNPGAPALTINILNELGLVAKDLLSNGIIEELPNTDSYMLTEHYHPITNPLKVPADIPVEDSKVNELVFTYQAENVFTYQIAQELELSQEKIRSLTAISRTNLFDRDFVKEIVSEETVSAPKLQAWTSTIRKLSILFQDKEYDEIFQEPKENEIIISLLPRVTNQESLEKVSSLRGFVSKDNIIHLTSVLNRYDQGDQKFEDGAIEALTHILKTEVTPTKRVNDIANLGLGPILALELLSKRVALAEYLGVGADVINQLVVFDPKDTNTEYDNLALVRNALLSAFRLKYPDDEDWQEHIEPFFDKIRGIKRDALTNYLINALHWKVNNEEQKVFANTRELYKFFLIDTELEGCTRTSRLVAAISTVQLLIHRIMLNLETNDIGAGEVLEIKPAADDAERFASQWEWRKNYRVWEANRKVFLYPETFIEPELRDNKTELFNELETDLMQREINTENVEEAYKKYLDGFEVVNTLQVAGAYHQKDIATTIKTDSYESVTGSQHIIQTEEINPFSSKDIIHLFAVTPGDENQMYYRKIENTYLSGIDGIELNWNSWEKLSLKVPVKKVSPIVYNGKLYVFWNEITTKQVNKAVNGNSFFSGYRHTVMTKHSYHNKSTNVWSIPQKIKKSIVVKDPIALLSNNGRHSFQITLSQHPGTDAGYDLDLRGDALLEFVTKNIDKIINAESGYINIDEHFGVNNYSPDIYEIPQDSFSTLFKTRYSNEAHFEPKDSYHFSDLEWERPYVDVYNDELLIIFGSKEYDTLEYMKGWVNLINNVVDGATSVPSKDFYYWNPTSTLPQQLYKINSFTFFSNKFLYDGKGISNYFTEGKDMFLIGFEPESINFEYINSQQSTGEIVLNDQFNSIQLVTSNYRNTYSQFNLTSHLTDRETDKSLYLSSEFSNRSKGYFLNKKFQKNIGVRKSKIQLISFNPNSYNNNFDSNNNLFNKLNPQSIYFWELFFHIPFLIANHLNSHQKFAEAQQWYHYIFNPNARPEIDATEEEIKAKKYVWQFRSFYDEGTMESMRSSLENRSSINVYENDPFNPHAIARTRTSAYPKAVVMKYIDNLLDWGDQLFEQDTMESINEATMLYMLAYEILGERPYQVGDCGEKKGSKTYKDLAENTNLKDNSNNATTPVFLEEIETQVVVTRNRIKRKSTKNKRSKRFVPSALTRASNNSNSKENRIAANANHQSMFSSEVIVKGRKPIFCIPTNKDLLAYWDRVDDRLFKIRNCMNIQGITRQRALFVPEIDPRLLVRARAQGLSIQDVLQSINGHLPPYRFQFLLSKARAYAGQVQNFGSALQSAMERKDAEQLSQLQATHQLNTLSMTRFIRDRELEAAESSLEALFRRKQTVENRTEHYNNLIQSGWSNHEIAASLLYFGARTLDATLAGIYAATTGLQAVPSIVGFSNEANTSGKVSQALAETLSFGREILKDSGIVVEKVGSYSRREQDWKFQLQISKDELKVIEEQITGEEIRKAIAERNYELFELSVEQQSEVFDFIKEKFSNVGLYRWMSSQLMRIYRQSWNSALSMAKMAERAYRFERSDDKTALLNGDYWDTQHHGLLAGQKLLNDLQNLELRFLETNYRKLEVNQSFSLMQIAPEALLRLKADGECNFSIPELFFDMTYPGQYKRRIRSARLSIPCIVGPYTNVGATLSLTGSRIRLEPKADSSLKEMPPTRTTTIATSTAQNDTGVFEFSFRDERYMPFEGAGAISDWNLKLPSKFRTFNYNTINDVILHISYEADYDGKYAQDVEGQNGDIESQLKDFQFTRLFSLQHDFPNEWHQFVNGVDNFKAIIKKEHFNYLSQGKDFDSFEIQVWSIDKKNNLTKLTINDLGDLKTELNNSAKTAIEIIINDSTDSTINKEDSIFIVCEYSLANEQL